MNYPEWLAQNRPGENHKLNFRAWLETQPLEQQREIKLAEAAWVRAHGAGVAEDPAESDFLESFVGYEDPPAGIVENRLDIG